MISSLSPARVNALDADFRPNRESQSTRLEPSILDLLAKTSGRGSASITGESDLTLDLGLDSLARVELVLGLEEKLGLLLSDETMSSVRTVGELVAVVESGTSSAPHAPLPGWPRLAPVRWARAVLQRLVLVPALRLLVRPWRVVGRGRLASISGPLLIVANHTSHLDSLAVLAALPAALRDRTAVAAAADYFFRSQPLASLAPLLLGAFPFHREGAVSTSLAHCADLTRDGYSILIFPEGTRSPSGAFQPFKPGIGLLARELRLTALPVYLHGL